MMPKIIFYSTNFKNTPSAQHATYKEPVQVGVGLPPVLDDLHDPPVLGDEAAAVPVGGQGDGVAVVVLVCRQQQKIKSFSPDALLKIRQNSF